MAWKAIKWGCGHTGKMQLYGDIINGPVSSRVAAEAGRDCLACWIEKWWKDVADPRSERADRRELAVALAASKGVLIDS